MDMEKDEIMRKYLEGDLSADEEQQALHMIADDEEMRAMLRFEQTLSESLSEHPLRYDESRVPADFTDSVMQAIDAREMEERRGFVEKLSAWVRQLWEPRQMLWRPAYAFVVVLLAAVALAYPLMTQRSGEVELSTRNDNSVNEKPARITDSIQQVSTGTSEVMLRFVYVDEDARSVAVAGDFNNWEPTKLTRQKVNGKVIWTGLVPMSRGEHHYMFVKNGDKWVTDPLAPVQRKDGFGNKNAVIYI